MRNSHRRAQSRCESLLGKRSNAPLTISATKESWVSRACPLSMASCISAFAPVRNIPRVDEHSRALARAVVEESHNSSVIQVLAPNMVPDLNAEMPSLHAPAKFFASCVNILQGTWQKDFNLPFPRLQSFKRRIVEQLRTIQRMFHWTFIGEQYRRGRDDLQVDPVTIHSRSRLPDPSTPNIIWRKNRSPTMMSRFSPARCVLSKASSACHSAPPDPAMLGKQWL